MIHFVNIRVISSKKRNLTIIGRQTLHFQQSPSKYPKNGFYLPGMTENCICMIIYDSPKFHKLWQTDDDANIEIPS